MAASSDGRNLRSLKRSDEFPSQSAIKSKRILIKKLLLCAFILAAEWDTHLTCYNIWFMQCFSKMYYRHNPDLASGYLTIL